MGFSLGSLGSLGTLAPFLGDGVLGVFLESLGSLATLAPPLATFLGVLGLFCATTATSFLGFTIGFFLVLDTRPPKNKNAFPREISIKSACKPFFCFFLLDSRSGLGGFHFNVTFSANRNSLANSRTNF